MPSLPLPLAAALTGVATTAYYATPDVLRTRRARAVAKVALSAVSVLALAVPEVRLAGATAAEERAATGEAAQAPDWRAALGALPPARRAALAAVPAVLLAGSVAAAVATERWIFRKGEARAAAGRRLPHTGPALLHGALAAALALIPPQPRRDPLTR
jgi:hypothetical protein